MNLYRNESGDPTTDAQRNLSGRTHYVDANTLRFHHSRILETQVLADGLLFGLVESVALDPDNRKRGYRAVLFDLFGTVLTRSSLDEARSSKATAVKDLNAAAGIDAVAVTRKGIERSRKYHAEELARLTVTLNELANKQEKAA